MEKLKELFQKAKIKYIISVDDCHIKYGRATSFSVKEHMMKNTKSALSFWESQGKAAYAKTIIDLQPADLLDFLTTICDELQPLELELYDKDFMNNASEREQTALVSFCKNLKSSGCIKDYVTLVTREQASKFSENIDKQLGIDAENKVLWMIDNDLSGSGGAPESGTELIKSFIQIFRVNHIFALTSAQVGDLNNEDFRKSISENIKAYESLLACVISKHYIVESRYNDLYSQISIGFRENYSGVIVSELKNIFIGATDRANSAFESFGNDTIHKVFFVSGKEEGVFPVEVFQRLLLVIVNADISKKIAEKYDEIAKLIHDYSQICDWCYLEKPDAPDFKIIRDIRISECYDRYINLRYLPVSYGDIFEINEVFYILIGQACNLTIRNNGNRMAQCATLAQISPSNEEDNRSQHKYIIQYFIDNKDYSIDFNQCINVDFNVLDLCTLNNAGLLKMSDTFDINSVRYRYPMAVYTRLKNVADENHCLIVEHKQLSECYKEQKFEDVCRNIRSIYKDNSLQVDPEFNDGISYKGSRISRLSAEIMDDILKNYSEYHSRKALNYDFAKDYMELHFDVEYELFWEYLDISKDNISNVFFPSYTFFQTEKCANEKEKIKKIQKTFTETYSNQFPLGTIELDASINQIDIKKQLIKVASKNIPVCVNGEILVDFIKTSSDRKISFKIPSRLVVNPKTKANGTYNMENGVQLKVSNSFFNFTFLVGVPLEFCDEDVLTNKITFAISFDKGLLLDINQTNVTS